MAKNMLGELSKKDNIKSFGKSPFSKKKNQDDYQVSTKMNRTTHEKIRRVVFENHSTVAGELDRIVNAGLKALEEQGKLYKSQEDDSHEDE